MLSLQTAPAPLPERPKRRKGLLSCAALFEWESRELPFLNTISGRTLYYAVAQRFLSDHPGQRQAPLKSLAICQTERAMRKRIDDFVAQGLLTVQPQAHDARSRDVVPTPKLVHLFEKHSQAMHDLFGQRFHILPKQD